jgi:hypothetical protein
VKIYVIQQAESGIARAIAKCGFHINRAVESKLHAGWNWLIQQVSGWIAEIFEVA